MALRQHPVAAQRSSLPSAAISTDCNANAMMSDASSAAVAVDDAAAAVEYNSTSVTSPSRRPNRFGFKAPSVKNPPAAAAAAAVATKSSTAANSGSGGPRAAKNVLDNRVDDVKNDKCSRPLSDPNLPPVVLCNDDEAVNGNRSKSGGGGGGGGDRDGGAVKAGHGPAKALEKVNGRFHSDESLVARCDTGGGVDLASARQSKSKPGLAVVGQRNVKRSAFKAHASGSTDSGTGVLSMDPASATAVESKDQFRPAVVTKSAAPCNVPSASSISSSSNHVSATALPNHVPKILSGTSSASSVVPKMDSPSKKSTTAAGSNKRLKMIVSYRSDSSSKPLVKSTYTAREPCGIVAADMVGNAAADVKSSMSNGTGCTEKGVQLQSLQPLNYSCRSADVNCNGSNNTGKLANDLSEEFPANVGPNSKRASAAAAAAAAGRTSRGGTAASVTSRQESSYSDDGWSTASTADPGVPDHRGHNGGSGNHPAAVHNGEFETPAAVSGGDVVFMDKVVYRQLLSDIDGYKSLLLQLQRNLTNQDVRQEDADSGVTQQWNTIVSLQQENAHLTEQVSSLKKTIDEKNRTISSLEHHLSQLTIVNQASSDLHALLHADNASSITDDALPRHSTEKQSEVAVEKDDVIHRRTTNVTDASANNRTTVSANHQPSDETTMPRRQNLTDDGIRTRGSRETDTDCGDTAVKVPKKVVKIKQQLQRQETDEDSYVCADEESSTSRYSRQQSMGSVDVLDSIFDYHSTHPSVDMDDVPFKMATDYDTLSFGDVFATVTEENNNNLHESELPSPLLLQQQQQQQYDKLSGTCPVDKAAFGTVLDSAVRRDHAGSGVVVDTVDVGQFPVIVSSAAELTQVHQHQQQQHTVTASRLPGPPRSRLPAKNSSFALNSQQQQQPVGSSSLCNNALTDIRSSSRNKSVMK